MLKEFDFEEKHRTLDFSMDYEPVRKMLFWGKDNNNNPSFLVLYGFQKFNTKQHNTLEDEVVFSNYAIFNGSEGHFPNFEHVHIPFWGKELRMYNNSNFYNNYYNSQDSNKAKELDNFKKFNKNEEVAFSYTKNLSYKDACKVFSEKNIDFENFTLVDNLDEVLENENFSEYKDYVYVLLGNSNLYLRKKYLKLLIEKNPAEDFYNWLVNIGNSELISALFLELAKYKNPALAEYAKNIMNLEIGFCSENKGIKRCAKIYLAATDETLKEKELAFIKENLKDLEIKIRTVNGTRVEENFQYNKYQAFHIFSEYGAGEYDKKTKKRSYSRKNDIFEEGYYSDGVVLDTLKIKDTIQKVEIFDEAEIIGKIAFFLDSNIYKDYFYARREGTKTLLYFLRYLRRIIDNYSKTDEKKFIKAIKALCVNEYISKNREVLDFEFYESYFYQRYLTKTSSYSYIWTRNIDVLIDIIISTNNPTLIYNCFLIFKDDPIVESLTYLPYEKLIKIASVFGLTYKQIKNPFLSILSKKIHDEKEFDSKVFLMLINTNEPRLVQLAANYLKSKKGVLSTDENFHLIFSQGISRQHFNPENILENFSSENLVSFLKKIFENYNLFKDATIVLNKKIKKMINDSLYKLKNLASKDFSDFVIYIISKLSSQDGYVEEILDLEKEIIFSIDYETLKNIIKTSNLNFENNTIEDINLLIGLFNSLKNDTIPSDNEIKLMLEEGSPSMVKTLTKNIYEFKDKLKEKANFTTILLLLESKQEALNNIAKEIFATLEGDKQRELHLMLIDSPVKKTYDFALQELYKIYQAKWAAIPEDFMFRMFEHPSYEVKSYISNKIFALINSSRNLKPELFLYYIRTLLYLPNKVSVTKKDIYDALPEFVKQNNDKKEDIENILLSIGGSNIISDAEKALVALAKIRKEAV